MNQVRLLLLPLLLAGSGQAGRLSHELPRLSSPYGGGGPGYAGYVSPLRPGYRWGSARSLPQSRYHYYPPPLPHPPPPPPQHFPRLSPYVVHLAAPTVVPARSEGATLSIIEEEETALEETPRAARENQQPGEEEEENYNFGYAVKDSSQGDDFSHQESHQGDLTRGEYRVALPDGRVQVESDLVQGPFSA